MTPATASIPTAPYPVFADIEPSVLEDAEPEPRTARQMLTGAWSEYLRRILPEAARGDYSAASA